MRMLICLKGIRRLRFNYFLYSSSTNICWIGVITAHLVINQWFQPKSIFMIWTNVFCRLTCMISSTARICGLGFRIDHWIVCWKFQVNFFGITIPSLPVSYSVVGSHLDKQALDAFSDPLGFYPSSRRLIRTSLLIIDSDDKCLMRGISDVKSASDTSPVHRDWPLTPSTSSSPIRFRCQKFHSYISQDSCTSRHFQFLSSTRCPIASLPHKNVGSESEGANDFVKALARNLVHVGQ